MPLLCLRRDNHHGTSTLVSGRLLLYKPTRTRFLTFSLAYPLTPPYTLAYIHRPPSFPHLSGNITTLSTWPVTFQNLNILDLSNNRLSGIIPREWSAFGPTAAHPNSGLDFDFSNNRLNLTTIPDNVKNRLCQVRGSLYWNFTANPEPNWNGDVIDRRNEHAFRFDFSTNICKDRDAPKVLIILWGSAVAALVGGGALLWCSLRCCCRGAYGSAHKPKRPSTRPGVIGAVLRFFASPAATRLRLFGEVWFWLLDMGTDVWWLV